MSHVIYQADTLGCFVGETTLVTCECPTCFVLYAIPQKVKGWAQERRGRSLVCPFGHEWHYIVGETDEERIKRLSDQVARERARHDQTRASLVAQRGAATRARNQRDRLKAHATAGVCPVDGCHRHFTNLERHISTKHPDYAHAAVEA